MKEGSSSDLTSVSELGVCGMNFGEGKNPDRQGSTRVERRSALERPGAPEELPEPARPGTKARAT